MRIKRVGMNDSELSYWLYKLLRSFGTKNYVELSSKQASLIMARKQYIGGVDDE